MAGCFIGDKSKMRLCIKSWRRSCGEELVRIVADVVLLKMVN
jgi:hypothetical protein